MLASLMDEDIVGRSSLTGVKKVEVVLFVCREWFVGSLLCVAFVCSFVWIEKLLASVA